MSLRPLPGARLVVAERGGGLGKSIAQYDQGNPLFQLERRDRLHHPLAETRVNFAMIALEVGGITKRVGELPTDQDVVMVCLSGARSARAAQFACQAGVKAVNMAGGMMAWRGPVER